MFVTTQTTRGQEDPSSAEVKNVHKGYFWTLHCEWENLSNNWDGCDRHKHVGGEVNGWVAIDPSVVNGQAGMAAGVVHLGNHDSASVTFNVSFSEKPVVFVQVQTANEAEESRNVVVTSRSTTGFTVAFCEQDSQDGCDSTHAVEKVAWWAVDVNATSKGGLFDWGVVSVHPADQTDQNKNWGRAVFSFASSPVVIASVEHHRGGQEALYPEVKGVNASDAWVRFCEADGADVCDTHSNNPVAWLAVPVGQLSYGGGGGGGGPTADFTVTKPSSFTVTPEANVAKVHVDASTSTGSSLSYAWTWGDGSAASSGVTANHYYPCTANSFQVTITLTVTDGSGRSDSLTKTPTVDSPDRDSDGLNCHQERVNGNGTTDWRKDTDGDGLSDYVESLWWPSRDAVFCKPQTTNLCAYPDPTVPDWYIQTNVWTVCPASGTCQYYRMNDTMKAVFQKSMRTQGWDLRYHIETEDTYQDMYIHGVRENFDAGQPWYAFSYQHTGEWKVTNQCGSFSSPYSLAFARPSQSCTYDASGANGVGGDASFDADLTYATVDPTLTFMTKWDVGFPINGQIPTDIMSVQASTDGGQTWTTLASWDNTMTASQSWTQKSVDLSPFIGMAPRIRFDFTSLDGTSSHAGWRVDDLHVKMDMPEIPSSFADTWYGHWRPGNGQVFLNPNYLSPDRNNIFHELLYVGVLTDSCGSAWAPGTWVVVQAHIQSRCWAAGNGNEQVVLQEEGHNDLGTIEPPGDQCSGSSQPLKHTKYWGYPMSLSYCSNYPEYNFYHWNRVTELKVKVSQGHDPDIVNITNSVPGCSDLYYQKSNHWYYNGGSGDLGHGIWLWRHCG